MSDTNISQQPLAEDSKVCSKPTCPKAGQLQPLSQFHRAARCNGGHRPECKTCHNKYRADWARQRYVPVTGRRIDITLSAKLDRAKLRAGRDQRRTARALRAELQAKGLRICSKPGCHRVGRPQPLSNFSHQGSKVCRDCFRRLCRENARKPRPRSLKNV